MINKKEKIDKKGKVQRGFYPFLTLNPLFLAVLLGFGFFLQSFSCEAQNHFPDFNNYNNENKLPPLSVPLAGELPVNYYYRQEQDTVAPKKKKERTGFSPGVVAVMSAIVPGAGQVYNARNNKLQLLKVPMFYGLFAGAGYWFHISEREYQNLRIAYRQRVAGEIDRYNENNPDNIRVIYSFGPAHDALVRQRESYHRDRDFAFILLTAIYAANILDAYVYAHLSTFDVSDDLSLQINPVNLINIAGQNYYSSGITLKFK